MRIYPTTLLKHIKEIFLICLFFVICVTVKSQDLIPVELALNKTVHLFFTSPVKYCDAGSNDVTYKANDNIVTITATKADFAETNFTVVTTDNYCYSFLLLYSSVPRQLNINPDPKKAKLLKTPNGTAVTTNPQNNTSQKPPVNQQVKQPVKPVNKAHSINRDSVIYQNCRKILEKDPEHQDVAVVQKQTGLMLSNVFVDDSCVYVSFYILNHSKKDFIPSFINFQIVEYQGILFTKMRDLVKKPVFIYNKKELFEAQKTEQLVYVFSRFKVDSGKKLCLEIGERNGDRLLSINIEGDIVNSARQIK